MKLIVLISIFGLSIFLTTHQNTSNLMAQSRLCYYQDGAYPEGAIITIDGRTYKCRDGKWIPV